MPHLHYSPYQFATVVEASTDDVNARKLSNKIKTLIKKDVSKTQADKLNSTLTVEQASMIPGSPTAFISPNPVGTMKDIGMPIAPTGIDAPKSRVVADGEHYVRKHDRQYYNDRNFM